MDRYKTPNTSGGNEQEQESKDGWSHTNLRKKGKRPMTLTKTEKNSYYGIIKECFVLQRLYEPTAEMLLQMNENHSPQI